MDGVFLLFLIIEELTIFVSTKCILVRYTTEYRVYIVYWCVPNHILYFFYRHKCVKCVHYAK